MIEILNASRTVHATASSNANARQCDTARRRHGSGVTGSSRTVYEPVTGDDVRDVKYSHWLPVTGGT